MDWKRAGKILGGGVVALIVLFGLLTLLGVIGLPNAGIDDNSWGDVGDDRIEILTTVWIENPNPAGIGGDTDIEYEVALADVDIASGEATGVGAPSGRSTQTVTTDLHYRQLPAWWSAHLNSNETSTAEVDAVVHGSVGPFAASPSGTYEREVETDIEGALDRGFSEFEGTYSGTGGDLSTEDGTAIEPTVEVREVSTVFGTVTEDETEILVTAEIHNPNAYPIPHPAFTGEVEFNEIPIADWNASNVRLEEAESDATIPAGETEQRTYQIEMSNGNVSEWFATHVENGEYTRMVVNGQLAMQVSGSRVTIPDQGQAVACEFDLTTAMFVDDQESDLTFQECGLSALETSESELETGGAVLDLTETDWWNENSDDGVLSARERAR